MSQTMIQVVLRFRLVHPGGRLGAEEREALARWINGVFDNADYSNDIGFPGDDLERWERPTVEDRAADNLAAIAKYVEAMRGQIRWGVADVATMFSGFKSLPGAIITPAQMTVEDAANFITAKSGGHESALLLTRDQESFRMVYRRAAMVLHPDAAGMATPEWQQLQDAKQVLETHYANGG